MIGRLVLGGVGVLGGCYGAWLLLSRGDGEDLRSAAVWLAGGVLLHDVLLAGLTLAVGAVVTRTLPRPARAPATVALVVLGSLTLVAVPVLGRFGAKADNPTLLDRPYVPAWLALVAVTVLVVTLVSVLRSRSGRTPGPARHADP